MNNEIATFDQFINNKRVNEKIPNNPDSYGDEIGISTKNSHLPLDQPQDGPTGDIVMSAYANLNVPTRKVPNTDYGNLGCAAAVSIIFYRATGYPLVPKKQIELSTSNLWRSLNKSRDWEKISDWRSQYQPGDIIITARGKRAGHVGVVVDGGKIISNSSGGFQGDQKGQIEMNYSIKGWESVAKRNPNKTALFRYKGKYKEKWTDEGGNVKVIKRKRTKLKNTEVNKLNRRYYKVWDKEHKRMLVAKYKKAIGDNPPYFKVYTKRRDKIGEVYLVDQKIILKDKSGERDVTSERVGVAFIKLFKLAGLEKGSATTKADITIPSVVGGKVQHKYTGEKSKNIDLIISEANAEGVTNPHAIVAILSVIGKESGFIPKSEHSYKNTSNSRLRSLFGKKLSGYTDQELEQLKQNDIEFYDVIYGNIAVQNGFHTWNNKSGDPVLPGDGYKYRGRGFNQLTFKQSYKEYAKITGVDIVNNPDLLNDPKNAAKVSVKFLLNRLKTKGIDPNAFKDTNEAIGKVAAANAGWGKDPSMAIANANKISPNFTVLA